MRVSRLTRTNRERARESVDFLELREKFGVIGDSKSERDGSVSLLAGEAEEAILTPGGLCTAKFAANIVTDGLDFSRLITGTRLIVGGCELELTRVGKPCYEDCAILQRGETCPIPQNCAFARVTRGGEIHTNDEINHKDTSDSSNQA